MIKALGMCGRKTARLWFSLAKSTTSSPVEVYSIVDGQGTCLSNHGSSVRAFGEIRSSRTVLAKVQDGVTVESIFVTPSEQVYTKPDSGWPIVVVLHSGPTSRITHSFDPCWSYPVPWLVSKGYAVLSVNYLGNSGRRQQFMSDMLGSAGSTDYSM